MKMVSLYLLRRQEASLQQQYCSKQMEGSLMAIKMEEGGVEGRTVLKRVVRFAGGSVQLRGKLNR
jgi:hypothetical protein